MRVIENAGRRARKRTEGNKSGENSGGECYESTYELTRFYHAAVLRKTRVHGKR